MSLTSSRYFLGTNGYFLRANDKIDFGTSVQIDTANLCSLSVHFRAKFDESAIDTDSGVFYNLVSIWNTDTTKTIFRVYKDGLALVARIQYATWIANTRASDMGLFPSGVPDTGWHSYLWTWGTTDQAGKMYRDGQLLTTTGSGNVGYIQPQVASPLVIGHDTVTVSAPPGVAICDIGIWAAKLTAANALDLANGATSSSIPTKLACSLPLQGSTPELSDAGLHQLTGTVTGT